ncbi:uncharacterized protein RHIMIDRAFT_28771 [Rhizopus microsporus ATCC 52813]|uniref:Uncharacterized protein n=1 Tax=Rhizopus microsporus ATCC 52813 TaxID=1340429 RepID=A0A2G4SQG5_RHIZD|nr:uncharacterized protein RHIMIDRAFT_28771 [Rhizopus microsporus ATCC 52813]PHZ11014.1 hypothetical protein RHIMIDRAFT_28771 [Rhizopus microsporus ATCC 52813]
MSLIINYSFLSLTCAFQIDSSVIQAHPLRFLSLLPQSILRYFCLSNVFLSMCALLPITCNLSSGHGHNKSISVIQAISMCVCVLILFYKHNSMYNILAPVKFFLQ